MNERSFTILFLIALVIGAGTLMFSKLQETSPTSSPTPGDLNFSQPSPAPQQAQQPTPAPQVKQYKDFPILTPEQLKGKKAAIVTAKGTIDIELYPEATKAASSFIFLSSQGFFDGLIFHRVEDWVIQGGDPTRTGRGGPGYQFADEPVTRPYVRGTLAMANAGPNTNGSQFFILKKDYPLQPNYTIFGKVTSGMEIVDKIAVGDIMQQIVISQ